MSNNVIEMFKMARKKNRRNKPTDPAEIARLASEQRRKLKNPANWGVNVEAAALPANADVVHEEDTRKNEARSHRYDIFRLLFTRQSITYGEFETVRELQAHMAAHVGMAGPAAAGSIRADGGGKDPIDAARAARASVEAMLSPLGHIDQQILLAVCDPLAGSNWRRAVERVTGRIDAHTQGAYVVRACKALAKENRKEPPGRGQISLGEMNSARDAA